MSLQLPEETKVPTTVVEVVQFRIYVGGDAPNSVLAVRNLRALCQERFDGNFSIDIVDVLLVPERAWDDGVMVTPTTMRLAPTPSPPVVGNLSDRQAVLQVFGLADD
jgi:circadian clock protein KaiB